MYTNSMYIIILQSLHTLTQTAKLKKLWLTSQDTSPLLNKVTHAPSDILIGQTRSPNSSHDLPKYLMMWRHLAPPPLWVSWDIVRLLTIEKTRKHDTTINIEMMLLLTMLWTLFIHIHWNYTDNHIYFIWTKLLMHHQIFW
jgi:hypothetical protein